jgi:hypothetical protein
MMVDDRKRTVKKTMLKVMIQSTQSIRAELRRVSILKLRLLNRTRTYYLPDQMALPNGWLSPSTAAQELKS